MAVTGGVGRDWDGRIGGFLPGFRGAKSEEFCDARRAKVFLGCGFGAWFPWSAVTAEDGGEKSRNRFRSGFRLKGSRSHTKSD